MRILKVVFSLIAVFFSANLLAADSCPNLSGNHRCENRYGTEYNVNITQEDGKHGTVYTLSYELEYYGIVETVRVVADGVERDTGERTATAYCIGGVLVKHFMSYGTGEVASGVYFMDDNDNLNVLINIWDSGNNHLDGSCSREQDTSTSTDDDTE